MNELEELDRRINTLKGSKEEKDEPFCHASNLGIHITAELLSGVLIGAGMGYFLDILFHTKPFMLIFFLLLGGTASFLNVYEIVKKRKNG